MHSGPWFFTELTVSDTVWEVSISIGAGISKGSSILRSSVSGSSQRAWVSSDNMTGMRLCIGSMKGLAEVVIMVHDWTNSPSGDYHVSHNPAKAMGSPFRAYM